MTTTTCASGWKSYRVALRQEEGRGIISLFLKPSDDNFPPIFTAGQYVNLRLPDMTSRAYFLTGPSEDRMLRITVEIGDEPHLGTLGYLAKLHIDDEVFLSAPYGNFTLEPGETPIVIITEGIGSIAATAFLSEMAVASPLRKVSVLCQVMNGKRFALADEIRKLVTLLPNAGLACFFTRPLMSETAGKDYDVAGPITVANVRSVCIAPDADFYITGNQAFVDGLKKDLEALGLIHSRIHTQTLTADKP